MAKEKSFEKMLAEIEEINAWFEGDKIDLDVGLEKLKQGKELVEKCREKLKEIENQFEEISTQEPAE